MENRKSEGRYDYSGSCSPSVVASYSPGTFSVGIFKWVLKARGKGLKKSKVVIRVRGNSNSPEDVYRLADKFCDMLDRGEDPGVKTVYATDMKWLAFVSEPD